MAVHGCVWLCVRETTKTQIKAILPIFYGHVWLREIPNYLPYTYTHVPRDRNIMRTPAPRQIPARAYS